MSLSFDRFKKIDTENSITNSKSKTDIQDTNSPYSLIEWLINSNLDLGDPQQYIQQYSEYLRAWAKKNGTKLADSSAAIIESYKTLLKEITLKFTTAEEKRYLLNLDFNNPADLDIAIPFYATRLKDIVIFLSKKREDTKFQKVKFSLFGTNEGTEKLAKNLILQLTNTEKFILDYFPTPPNLAAVSKELIVQTEEFYDTKDDYYNVDPCIEGDNRGIDYDPYIFLDFTKAIKKLAEDLGTTIQSSISLSTLTSSSAASAILSNSTDVDVTQFDLDEFLDYIQDKSKLNLHNQKALANQLIGNNTVYLSSGSSAINSIGNTAVQYVTGEQLTPKNSLLNFFNKDYPTINYSPGVTDLHTKRQLGGFFTPQHLGTSSYASFNPKLRIKTELLANNKIYEIPDPSIYGSMQHPFIDHWDDASWVKADRSNDNAAGDIINSNKLQKLYNYQSTTEDSKLSKHGVARVEDNFDFWTGDLSDIWDNEDVYPLLAENIIDSDSRQKELFTTKGDIYKWQSDIFGNDFALFKFSKQFIDYRTDPHGRTTKQGACSILDGNSFINIYTGTDDVNYPCKVMSRFIPRDEANKVLYDDSNDQFTSNITTDVIGNTIYPLAYAATFPYIYCDFNQVNYSNITYICQIMDGEESPDNWKSDNITLEVNEYPARHNSDQEADGFTSTKIVDTHWDGHFFSPDPCQITYTTDFNTLGIPFLSAIPETCYQTSYRTPPSDSFTPLTIYEQRHHTYGDLVVRNINNTLTGPVTAILAGLYSKYELVNPGEGKPNIKIDLETRLLDFQIIHDTLILRTQNYYIFEKLKYNYTTNEFDIGSVTNYVPTGECTEEGCSVKSLLERSIHSFFNEHTNKVYLGTTRSARYNGVDTVLVYPEIHEYDLTEFKLKKVFPDSTAISQLSGLTLPDDLTLFDAIGFGDMDTSFQSTTTTWDTILSNTSSNPRNPSTYYQDIDHPIITYNELIDRYYITASCLLNASPQPDLAVGGVQPQTNIFGVLKYEFKLFDGKFECVDSSVYFPKNHGYDKDIVQNQSVSVTLSNASTSTEINSVSGYELGLSISPKKLSSDYGYIKFIYDFGDGSDLEVENRNIVENVANATADNATDISDPSQTIKTHTYHFTNSASETIYAKISAIDHNLNLTEFAVNINREPYTLLSAFSGLKIIESKSFLDDSYQERNLLVLESQSPRTVFNMTLNGHTYNKTNFKY
jgi:hypothetical protein